LRDPYCLQLQSKIGVSEILTSAAQSVYIATAQGQYIVLCHKFEGLYDGRKTHAEFNVEIGWKI
jgi:hypothetical protein